MSSRALLIPAVLLIVSGCASRGADVGQLSPLLSDEWAPPEGQTCTVQSPPSWASDPEALLDENGTRLALAQDGGETGTGGHAVLSVRFNGDGERGAARVVESTLPEGAAEGLEEAVVERLPAAPGETRHALLHVEADDEVRVSAGGMEYCRCTVLDRERLITLIELQVRNLRQEGVPPGSHRVVVNVRSNASGQVMEKEFDEPSDYPPLNRAIWRMLDQVAISPAIVNRRFQGWSRLPIVVTIPE